MLEWISSLTDKQIAFAAAVAAIVSVLLAVFALAYSRSAVKEAQRANKIAVHQFKRNFYEAYEQLLAKVAGARLSEDDVNAFQIQANLAEVYLPEALACEVELFHESCWDLVEAYNSVRRAKSDLERARMAGMRKSPSEAGVTQSYDEATEMVVNLTEEWVRIKGRAVEKGADLGDSLRLNMSLVR